METYVELDHEDEQRFAAEIAREENTEVKEMEVTWEEALKARESIGVAKGESIGLAEGVRSAIVKLLNRRFGAVSDEVVDALSAITDIDRLNELLDQAIDISSIDELDMGEDPG